MSDGVANRLIRSRRHQRTCIDEFPGHDMPPFANPSLQRPQLSRLEAVGVFMLETLEQTLCGRVWGFSQPFQHLRPNSGERILTSSPGTLLVRLSTACRARITGTREGAAASPLRLQPRDPCRSRTWGDASRPSAKTCVRSRAARPQTKQSMTSIPTAMRNRSAVLPASLTGKCHSQTC